ncbi:MAG: hypothetical protein CM15mP9_2400 [Methanobacteriota archaeon]|nr:MAG: hypothetical protein CM15mP9_2400 [Euryarchaeota archaeon]
MFIARALQVVYRAHQLHDRGRDDLSKVSYEVRRQLNTLRTMDGHRSVDSFLADMIRAHKLGKMNGELDKLREQMKEVADVSAEHLVQRLNLAPFKV